MIIMVLIGALKDNRFENITNVKNTHGPYPVLVNLEYL